jgi:hypothetical protein
LGGDVALAAAAGVFLVFAILIPFLNEKQE